MKKLIYFLGLILAVSAITLSCDKKERDLGGDCITPEANFRIATYADDWDAYVYTYSNNGTLKIIERNIEEGVAEKTWNFAYNGSSVTVTGSGAYTFTLNADKYVTQMVSGTDTYKYAYTNGFLTEVQLNDVVISKIIIANSCLKSWTRLSGEVEQIKQHVYGTENNVAGIQNIYCEKTGVGRWLHEAGFFGKASAKLCTSNKWDHSETSGTFTYEKDNKGRVTKEIKSYGAETELSTYTWVEY